MKKPYNAPFPYHFLLCKLSRRTPQIGNSRENGMVSMASVAQKWPTERPMGKKEETI